MGLKENLVGDPERYDYSSMCMPNNPWSTAPKKKLNFYAKDEKIPILLALVMGLQHAFAMVGGLVTPPLVVFKFSVDFMDQDLQQYAIAAALITSGICSFINIMKLPIPFTQQIFGRQMFLGSGVLSVMGTSFTFLPIYEIAIQQMKDDGIDGRDAYGKMLGTTMLCCLLELFFSVVPVRYIKRIFPPIVTAITVILIGVALIGTGMKYWGGGVVCAEMGWKEHAHITNYDPPLSFPPPFPTCANGEVELGYGSPEYIGLGFSVMVGLVFIEIFGSTFMKNCNVFLALLFGYFVAGVSSHDGYSYVDSDAIKNANPITFLWVETFPIGFYGPAVIPLLIAYLVTTVETIGDLTAVYEVSELDTEGEEYQESIQGGLTADAIGSILASLFTTLPNTTFSQNNGVIALTKCASRRAGLACGMWLVFMGVFSKIAGIITSIPDAVLGGMTIFLFANVLASGIALASTLDLHSRRVKFIMALSLAIGVGVTVWPFAFLDMRGSSYTANFWQCADCSETLKGLRNGVSIFLSTGYCVGTVAAMFLNAILPADAGVNMGHGDDEDAIVSDETNKAGQVVEDEASEVATDDVEAIKRDISDAEVNEVSA
ncbi:Putative purine permease C1399.01c [Seminavis robusta]|uniref:Purine permease C1399.01c n=1 Tax=Seminavis robusta TaxID=568900 RepID=A0A9N8DQ74_9STRA|nr:Putative purine permease C1399.01c [Seminavis robusta]|eukprot:Sro276_g106080.1 Putative purine permease C1399.01c (602) ;mRNA; r:63628-65830